MSSALQKLLSLNFSKDLRKIVANIGWLFAGRFLRMTVGLFVGVWIARYLGVVQFGLLSYAMAFVALFNTFSNLGLPALVVRTITHEPDKKEQILGTTFWLQLFGGIATLLLSMSIIVGLHHNDRLTMSLVGLLASAGIFRAFETIDLWFQSQLQSKYTVVAKNTAFLVVSIAKVVLINMRAPLLAFAWATLAEVLIGAVGLILFYKIQGCSLRLWRWSLPLAKSLLKESWPLILSGFSIVVYMKIDQIMLKEMIGPRALGLYSSATRISEVWYFVPTAIASSFAPSIYAARQEKNTISFYQKIAQLLRILSIIVILIAIPMTFMSGNLINLLYGYEYREAGSILAIHIWSALFVFTGVGTSAWFIAEGLTYLSFRKTLLGAITNVILNLFLIPTYSGDGAAVATVISYSIAAFFSNAFSKQTRGLFYIQLKSFLLIK